MSKSTELRPEVKALILGIANPASNIVAVHFDGPVLAEVLEFARLNCDPNSYHAYCLRG